MNKFIVWLKDESTIPFRAINILMIAAILVMIAILVVLWR